jgi:hypothetical protein
MNRLLTTDEMIRAAKGRIEPNAFRRSGKTEALMQVFRAQRLRRLLEATAPISKQTEG